MSLGPWAVIDIETTGVNSANDEIIDIGYYQFDGIKLTKNFSSLVRPNNSISSFITKLTGITNQQLKLAPIWESVEPELLELENHHLIAHNAAFEESFLKRYFDRLPQNGSRENYNDSLIYLALLFPEAGTLNLEYFMNLLGIADKEEHRGLADARDLLKVLLVSTYLTHQDKDLRLKLYEVFLDFSEEFWFKKFFNLSEKELIQISDQIDFALVEASKRFILMTKQAPITEKSMTGFDKTFSGQNIQEILRA